MGAGGFQLVDELPYIRETLGDVLVSYADYGQLKDAIAKYFQDDESREQIALRSRDIALAGHTFSHRVREILVDCGF